MNVNGCTIVNLQDENLIELISSANRRLVFIAPAVTVPVARALAEAWDRLGPENVRMVLDVDPEVYRLGYGEFPALTLLKKSATQLGATLYHQAGRRIGLLVVDSATSVYAPTSLLVEVNTGDPKANAVRIDHTPVLPPEPPTAGDAVPIAQSHVVQQQLLTEPELPVALGPSAVSEKRVETVEQDLKKNLPVDFSRSRQVARFNQHFQFVEFELRGLQISCKTVRIRSDLLGLTKDAQIQRLLRTTYRLISEDSGLSGQPIMELKRHIQEKYLISLTGYGTIVLRDNKKRFEDAVRGLESCIACFQKKVREKLQEQINKNRAALVKALLPNVRKNPPTRWQRYLTETSSPEAIRRLLERELNEAFGNAEDVLRDMKLKKVFKNISDELLNDREFLRTVRKALPTRGVLDGELAKITLPEGASGASGGRSWRP